MSSFVRVISKGQNCARIWLSRNIVSSTNPQLFPKISRSIRFVSQTAASRPMQESTQSLAALKAQASSGNLIAQLNLGQAYLSGHHGLNPSPLDANHWIKRAADGGSGEAQFLLGVHALNGVGMDKDEKSAAEWFRLSAAQGVTAAHFNLGLCYEEGNGVAQDLTRAALHYAEAAAKDDLQAAVKLARLYLAGQGVEQDVEAAKNLLRRPANRGVAEAQLVYGILLAQMEGPLDRKAGVKMVEEAAASGLPAAMLLLGNALAQGWWGAKDEEQGVVWLQRAARLGHAEAQYALYLRLSKGKGLDKEAATWLEKAAAAGHPDAVQRLAEAKAAGT